MSEREPLTRAEIVERLRSRLGLSARDGGLILDAFLETVADQLDKGGAVTISGLGRFAAKASPARPARNPATGQAAVVPARIRPVFTLSQSLRTMISSSDYSRLRKNFDRSSDSETERSDTGKGQ